jgi:hypothetical protein
MLLNTSLLIGSGKREDLSTMPTSSFHHQRALIWWLLLKLRLPSFLVPRTAIPKKTISEGAKVIWKLVDWVDLAIWTSLKGSWIGVIV